jgi:hypothetical protein
MDTKQKVTKILKFNHIVSVILIPTWRELKNVNLFDSIWYDSVFFKIEKQHFINEIRKYSKDNNISIEEAYKKIYI